MNGYIRTINTKLRKHPKSRKVLIMGGGPVGLYLANYILSRNLLRPDDTYHVVLIDKRFNQTRDQVVIIQNDIISGIITAHSTPFGYYYNGASHQDWITKNGPHNIINDELLTELIKYSCHQFDAPLHLRNINGSVRNSMASTPQELQEYHTISTNSISQKPYTADQTGCKIPYKSTDYYRRIGNTGIPGGLTIPINKLQYLLTTLNLQDKYSEWYTFVLMDKNKQIYESFMKSLISIGFDIVHCAIGSPENIVSPKGSRRSELGVLNYVYDIQHFYENIVRDKHPVKYQKTDGTQVDCWGQVCQIKLKEYSDAGKEFEGILLNSQNLSKSFGCSNTDSCHWIKNDLTSNNVQNKHRLFAKRNKNLSKMLQGIATTDMDVDTNINEITVFVSEPNTKSSRIVINQTKTITDLMDEIEKKTNIKKNKQILYWNGVRISEALEFAPETPIFSITSFDVNFENEMKIQLFRKGVDGLNIDLNESITTDYDLYLGLVLTNKYDPKNLEQYNYIVMHIILALERMGIPNNEIEKIANISNPFPIDKYNPDLDHLPYINLRGEERDIYLSNDSSIVYPVGDTLYPHHFFSGAGVGRGFVASAFAFESCVRLDNIIKENKDKSNKNIAPVYHPFLPNPTLGQHPNQHALLEIEGYRKVIRQIYRDADQATNNVSTENSYIEELEQEFQRIWSNRANWPIPLEEIFQEIVGKSKVKGSLKKKKSKRNKTKNRKNNKRKSKKDKTKKRKSKKDKTKKRKSKDKSKLSKSKKIKSK